MGTWLAFTKNGRLLCGTLHYVRLDGRYGITRLKLEASRLLENHSKFYDGAVVYKGYITDYDNQNRILFTI